MIGNTDNHIKNVSLLYGEALNEICLAPAYDIVSTVIYENTTENMSLGIDGNYDIREITRESFAKEAAEIGMSRRFAMRRFDKMVECFDDALDKATEKLSKEGFEAAEEVMTRIRQKGGISLLSRR